jgi:hypothetical protein
MIQATITVKGSVTDPARYRVLAEAVNDYTRMEPLLTEYERVMVEDLTTGVMEGVGGNDRPVAPVTYRDEVRKATPARAGAAFGTSTGKPKYGPAWPANLKSSEYRKLTGPALAPRHHESRILANFETSHFRRGTDWVAAGRWRDFVNAKGDPLIPILFAARLHGGIREWGREEARRVTRVWLNHLMRTLLR